jgi:hypothetical protein
MVYDNTSSHPCPQTIVQQTEEWEDTYWRRDSQGEPLPINLQGPVIPNNVPYDHEIRDTARELSNGQAGRSSKMRAKDIKQWLCSITLEDDPEKGPDNVGEGDN